MRSGVTRLLALAALVCAVSAVRPFMSRTSDLSWMPGADMLFGGGSMSFGGTGGIRTGIKASLEHHWRLEDKPFILFVRYIVPPSVQEEFIERWEKCADKTEGMKGLELQDMKRVTTTNILYIQYEEWDSMDDKYEHLKTKHANEFYDWVDENGVRWEMEPLMNESEELEEDQMKLGRSVARRKEEQKADEKETHVYVFYDIPPAMDKDFIEAWNDMASKSMEEEKGNRWFALRRFKYNNNLFYGYSTWKSIYDLQDHVHSKHFGRLHDEFAGDSGMVWYMTPLGHVGEHPHGRGRD